MYLVIWNGSDWGEDFQESRSFSSLEEANAFFQSLILKEAIVSVYIRHSSTTIRAYEK